MNIPAFVSGVGVWTLLEYAMHRFLLHGPWRKLHLPHHREPEGGYDWKPTLLAGLLAGYVAYSYLHSGLHHNAGPKGLREEHSAHHDHLTCNFGVTTTFWDRVFKSQCVPAS